MDINVLLSSDFLTLKLGRQINNKLVHGGSAFADSETSESDLSHVLRLVPVRQWLGQRRR